MVSKVTGSTAEVAMATGEVALGRAEALAGDPPECGLIELCRQGDAQAFGRLFSLHEAMVFNLSLRLLGDSEEARDVSQEVFLQVYRRLGSFQGRSSLKTWIFRIVVNQCRNRQRWWRRRRKERCFSVEELSAAEEAQYCASRGEAEDPFERLERRECVDHVQKALLQLSFEHRVILTLREMEGLPCEEIAGTLSLPQGTVKSRLARARESLRRALVPFLEGRNPS